MILLPMEFPRQGRLMIRESSLLRLPVNDKRRLTDLTWGLQVLYMNKNWIHQYNQFQNFGEIYGNFWLFPYCLLYLLTMPVI